MLVTPAKKKFGKWKPGDTFELTDRAAKALIRVGILLSANVVAADVSPRTGLPKRQYRRRDMQAES